MNKKTTADKLGTKTLETKAVAKRLTPFEDLVHLAAIGRLSLAGRQDIGAIILKKKIASRLNFALTARASTPRYQSHKFIPSLRELKLDSKNFPKVNC